MNSFRITPRLIVGLAILILGVLLTLDNFGFHTYHLIRWWPVVLIVIGLVRLLDPTAGKGASIVLLLIGGVFLLDNVTNIDVDFSDLFPLLIALLGAKLIWDAIGRRSGPRLATEDPNSTISAFAIMAGVHRQSTSREFRGGDANAIMGGVEIDLRNADIREGEIAELDTFALWGGVEIRVPENWRILGKVMPLMGGFEDKTAGKHPGPGPTLVVRGAAIMGAVEVKN